MYHLSNFTNYVYTAEIDNITYSTLTVTNLATCYYLRRYIKEQIIEFSRWIPS